MMEALLALAAVILGLLGFLGGVLWLASRFDRAQARPVRLRIERFTDDGWRTLYAIEVDAAAELQEIAGGKPIRLDGRFALYLERQ